MPGGKKSEFHWPPPFQPRPAVQRQPAPVARPMPAQRPPLPFQPAPSNITARVGVSSSGRHIPPAVLPAHKSAGGGPLPGAAPVAGLTRPRIVPRPLAGASARRPGSAKANTLQRMEGPPAPQPASQGAVAPAVVVIPLSACFARVQSEPIFTISGIGSEEASLMALKMELGGAKHFLCATDMLQYLYLNKECLNQVITLVIPGLHAKLAQLGLDIEPPKIQAVTGTIEFQTMKNMSEYRLGDLQHGYTVHIEAKHFYAAIKNQSGNGAIICGITLGSRNITIILTFTTSDFWSTMFQKDVLSLKGQPSLD